MHSFNLALAFSTLLLLSHSLLFTRAANADEWRKRSIYQIIVDRYALPTGSDLTACDPGQQTWCGGTWNTIKDNLDYIQGAGFTAIWISPVSRNYEGERTPYGDPYHGYWIADASQLNSKFGSADDLTALSNEVHRRGMLLMVDVVVNDVMSLSNTTLDYDSFMFKDPSQYHTYCPVDYSNITSEQDCWLGDTEVFLPDIKTEDPSVVAGYNTWIADLVKTYNIDGLRLDAAKHVNDGFWPPFCASANIFCIGEVFDADPSAAAAYQGPQAMDAILHYPMYNALLEAFALPGPQNMSAVSDMIEMCEGVFADTTLLGNFLENQDVPRWANGSVDEQSMYNAMVFGFMGDGIPIVYYGQEQYFHGASDPWNREPLWTSGYDTQTKAYQLMQTMNQLRNYLVNSSDWASEKMQVLSQNNASLAIKKGDVVTVVTNIGSPPQNTSIAMYTGFADTTVLFDVITCDQYLVGSGGALQVEYSKGGVPRVFVREDAMAGTALCGYSGVNTTVAMQSVKSGGERTRARAGTGTGMLGLGLAGGMGWVGVGAMVLGGVVMLVL